MRATCLGRPCSIQIDQKLVAGFLIALRTTAKIAGCNKKQQQQQLSQKASTRQDASKDQKGALQEQRISTTLAPFSSSKRLAWAFVMCSERPLCCLSAAANSSSSSSAGKCQPDRLPVTMREERCESNESPALFLWHISSQEG